MQHQEAHNLIEASPLFRGMQPEETEAILARLQSSHYSRGSLILERGIWQGRLYIVASGQVRVMLQRAGEEGAGSGDEEAFIVARLGPGECFGEMSLITGEPPGATIQAEQDTLLWSLAQTDFLTLVGTCPTLLRNINAILSQRLARTNLHLASSQSASIHLLSLIDDPEASQRLIKDALAYHIAEALARCSCKRVLLLELCGPEQAATTRFAVQPDQLRPCLLACAQDRSLLQAHRAPIVASDDRFFPAVALLADHAEQVQSLDAQGLLALDALSELAALYDYILLVSTPGSPDHLREPLVARYQAVYPHASRGVIALVSSTMLERFLVSQGSNCSVFVTDVVGPPTIKMQDYFSRQVAYPVTRLLPADDDALRQCWQEQKALCLLAPASLLCRAVDFVARYIAHQTVGIAFGGGGARGFAHLGILEGLLAHGVPLDYIAACSSGIIAPGMYLVGKPLAEIATIFMEVQNQVGQWRFPRTSLFSNRGIRQMLQQICGDLCFEDLTTPFAMVAVDLTTRSGVVLERGPIWRAGLASVALPGIFPPVVIGEHILADAGMHDPVPIRLARRMGADILLAAELGGQDPPALTNATPWLEQTTPQRHTSMPNIIDLLLRSYDLAMATIGMHSIREADVVIRPKLHRVSLRQFSEGRKFIVAGREAVELAMPALRQKLPWLT